MQSLQLCETAEKDPDFGNTSDTFFVDLTRLAALLAGSF